MYMNYRDERSFSLSAIKTFINDYMHVQIIYVCAYMNSICEQGHLASDQVFNE